jgi:DMSO/TMAO reductase YedYZ molybdopterin-dependent catalytic subunit
MEKRFFQIPLLIIISGLIGFSSLNGVRGTEFAGASTGIAASDSERRLLIDGAVSQPLNLTFNELVAMPRNSVYAELYCFGNFVDRGNWTGVRLGLLLEKAGLYKEAENVAFYAEDGYTILLPISTAINENVILAYEKDGQALPETLRLVIPGANGDKWIAMITQIIVGTIPVSIPVSIQDLSRIPLLERPPIPQQSQTPQPLDTPQPDNQSTTPLVPPVIPPSTKPPVQQQGSSGSSIPMEYGYTVSAVIVAIAAATGYLYLKRKKQPKQSPAF